MELLLVSLVLGLIITAASLIGRQFAEDRQEANLLWKLMGYGVLGIFFFQINYTYLPIGYVVALILASRANVNRKARCVSATATFAFWLVSTLIC